MKWNFEKSRLMSFALLCCVFFMGLGTAHAQQTLYAATTYFNGSGLYTVNPSTAASTLVGTLLAGGLPIGITGLSFNPNTGVLYGVTDDGSPNYPDYLVTLNTSTAAATLIGPLGTTGIADISFSSTGTLYGWAVQATTFLVSINLTTGTATPIGTPAITPNNADGGLAFSPTGVLYAENNIGNTACCSPYPYTIVFETVNPTTGATTQISSSMPFGDSDINAMKFNAAGVLYASAVDSDGYPELYTVDPATGSVTDIGSLPASDPFNGGQTNALAFSPAANTFQIGYAANLNAGDSTFNLTNVGTLGGSDPGGDICANIYVFAPDQQLIACCSCPLTPNHLKTLSAKKDLIVNTLTPGVSTAISVAFVPSTACDASAVNAGNVVPGLQGWGTTLHSLAGGAFGVTETPLQDAQLSISELAKMATGCAFIEADGSSYGICNACQEGAQGAAKQ